MERINWIGQSWLRTRNDLNEIRVFNSYCEMDLYDNLGNINGTTTFDVDLLDSVKHLKWGHIGTHHYVAHDKRYGTPRITYLHHLALPQLHGMLTDHIDGDVMNNLRSNLRYVTNAQNQWNTPKVRGFSKYKGVSFTKRGTWRGYVQCNKAVYTSKDFKTEEEAVVWVCKKRLALHGEFANHGDNINVTTQLQPNAELLTGKPIPVQR